MSIITLQNQKEIFMEEDFLEGLQLCNTQFDLVEAFSIIGHAIKIKRYQGSLVNPWLIEVKLIAKHHKAIDSLTLLQNEYQMEFSTGVENKKEIVNCVLPLFDFKDKDLRPLLQHRLYHLLMTFNAV
jgi:hypothetical protein